MVETKACLAAKTTISIGPTQYPKGPITMSGSRRNPPVSQVLLHVVLALLTGGIWLLVLLIWYILKK